MSIVPVTPARMGRSTFGAMVSLSLEASMEWVSSRSVAGILAACVVSMAAGLVCSISAFGASADLDRALSLWIVGKDSEALEVVTASALPPQEAPGACRGDSAALWNVGARLLLESYEREGSLKSKAGRASLRKAENYAAAAVWECPHDSRYWRDYVRIATEQRSIRDAPLRVVPLDQARETLRRNLLLASIRYPEAAPAFVLTEADELRHIGHAFVREAGGDHFVAQEILQSWIAEPVGRTRCNAAAVLAEMQLDAGDFTGARELLNAWTSCSGVGGEWLRARWKLLQQNVTVVSMLAVVPAYEEAAPHAQETIIVRAPSSPFMEIADRVLRDCTDRTAWDDLTSAAGTDANLLGTIDLLVNKMSERWRPPCLAAERARLLADIRAGEFEGAQQALDKMLKSEERIRDAEIFIAAVLVATDEDLPARTEEAHSWLARARDLKPDMAACIDPIAIEPCLGRKDECSLGSVLCRDVREPLYFAWSRGWTRRPSGTYQLAKVVENLKTRVDLNFELTKQIEPRIMNAFEQERKSVEQRFADYNRRLQMIETVGLPTLSTRIDDVAARSEEEDERLRRDIEQERALRRGEVRRLEEAYLANRELINIVAAEFRSRDAEASRVLRELAADIVLLKSSRPDLRVLLEGQWEHLQAQFRELRALVAELGREDMVRYLETLMNPRKASPEHLLNAFAHILDEAIQVAMPGKLIVRAIPILKVLSDILVDRYERMRRG